MKEILLISCFLLANCVGLHAQFRSPEIDKVKEISLLKSNRYQVETILLDYKLESTDDSAHTQRFSTDNFTIEVIYSSGTCSGDSDIWAVREWTAIGIEISPDEPISVESVGVDLSKLQKEREYEDQPSSYVFYDKNLGFAVHINKKEISKIVLFGSSKSKSPVCDSENAKKFVSSKGWFVSSQLEERQAIRESSPFIIDLVLSVNEFTFSDPEKDVSITTKAYDTDDDVLIYRYTVTGGKIIGQGPNVTWSLKGLQPGIYQITAGVDDGCGLCARTMTKVVTIK